MKITKKEIREFLKARQAYKEAKEKLDKLSEQIKNKLQESGIRKVILDGVEVSLIEGARLEPVENVLRENFPDIYKRSLSPDIRKLRMLEKLGEADINELVEKGGVKRKIYYQIRVK